MEPKILTFDIETAPITGYVWGMFDQNLGLNQIKEDWHLLAWAAKWTGSSKIMYMDNSRERNVTNDKKLISGLWNLLDQADIVVTQNGDKFDIKKFNARAMIHGLKPPSPFRSTDTYKESKRVASFTSHSLEYMASKLNKKYQKLKHPKYPGMELWTEVLKGNQDAWKEMKLYCIQDVLVTDELFTTIQGWIKTQNMACYSDNAVIRCTCGSSRLIKKGPVYTDAGKFQGYKCLSCGKRPKGRINLFSKEKKNSLLKDRR